MTMTPEQRPGTEIAGYRIESLIGRGGMAVVYRAEDMRLGRKVALKLLTPLLADSEQFRQRFIKESRLAASLDHPNIVPIYEAGEADGQLFIAMRYVIGSDLKGLLAEQGGHLPGDRTLRLFTQIGDALDSAHRAGLVHRDVKPANILVAGHPQSTQHGSGDHVYLTDFGLTKRTSDLSGGLTGTGHFLGTVDYVAPEQIQGRPVGPGTDIYALGCVLYECLTGQLPFHRDDDAALLWAHLVEAPPPVTGIRPDLPAEVNDVIARAMAKDPADRYATSGEFVHELVLAFGMPVHVAAPRSGTQHGRAGRHAETSDGSLTGAGTVTGDVDGGGRHPSFPPAPHPMFPSDAGGAQHAPPSADDEPEPEQYHEYDEYDEPSWDEEERETPPETAHRRRWVLVALAAAAVVLVVGAVVLVRAFLLSEDYREFSSTETVVPFRLDIPDDWTAVQAGTSDIVLGPTPNVADDLFVNGGRPEDWAELADVVRSGSPDAVWLYATSSNTTFDHSSADALGASLAVVLPEQSEFDRHRNVDVAGERVDELDAVTFDPDDPDTRLQVLVDVVQPSGTGGAVVLAFFAPPATFEDHLPTFERIRDSLTIGR
jgi:serine/threonine protein kinase